MSQKSPNPPMLPALYGQQQTWSQGHPSLCHQYFPSRDPGLPTSSLPWLRGAGLDPRRAQKHRELCIEATHHNVPLVPMGFWGPWLPCWQEGDAVGRQRPPRAPVGAGCGPSARAHRLQDTVAWGSLSQTKTIIREPLLEISIPLLGGCCVNKCIPKIFHNPGKVCKRSSAACQIASVHIYYSSAAEHTIYNGREHNTRNVCQRLS